MSGFVLHTSRRVPRRSVGAQRRDVLRRDHLPARAEVVLQQCAEGGVDAEPVPLLQDGSELRLPSSVRAMCRSPPDRDSGQHFRNPDGVGVEVAARKRLGTMVCAELPRPSRRRAFSEAVGGPGNGRRGGLPAARRTPAVRGCQDGLRPAARGSRRWQGVGRRREAMARGHPMRSRHVPRAKRPVPGRVRRPARSASSDHAAAA